MSEGLFTEIYGEEVTSRQLALLTAVAARPDASQSQIAQDIGFDVNTCSDIVVRAIAKGLLRRTRSESDGRTFELRVTDAGAAIVIDGLAKATTYADATAANLTGAERTQLLTLLRKMLNFP